MKNKCILMLTGLASMFTLILGNGQGEPSIAINLTKQTPKNAHAVIDGNTYDVSGLGYSIDAVKSDGTGSDLLNGVFKVKYPVLNQTFIDDTLSKLTYVSGIRKTESEYTESNSIVDFTQKFTSSSKVTAGVDVNYSIFTAGIKLNFETSCSLDFSVNTNSFFFNHKLISSRYALDFQNITDTDSYCSNLTSHYVKYLTEYLNGAHSYEDFFDRYGSHIVTSAVYGGMVDTYYTMVTNEYKIDASLSVKIGSSMSLGIEKVANGSGSVENEIKSSTNIDIKNTDKNLSITAIGGNTFKASTFEKYSESIDDWCDTLTNDNCSLVTISNMIPLYDLLPGDLNTSVNKLKMYNDLIQYSKDNEIDFSKFKLATLSDLGDTLTLSLSPRNRTSDEVYTIYDTGAQYQSYDTFNLNDTGYTLKELRDTYGYKTVTFQLYFDGYEESNGTEFFYITRKEKNTSSKYCWNVLKINGDKTNDDFEPQDITFKSLSLKYDNVPTDDFYMVYSTEKNGKWKLKNLRLKVKLSKVGC